MHIDLRSFLEEFNRSARARFVTNGGGFILEVNQSAANMFKSVITDLKHKSLITFGSRKKGCDALRSVRDIALNLGKASMPRVAMRPRGEASFRVNVSTEVLIRTDTLVLIQWFVADADTVEVTHDNPNANAAE